MNFDSSTGDLKADGDAQLDVGHQFHLAKQSKVYPASMCIDMRSP